MTYVIQRPAYTFTPAHKHGAPISVSEAYLCSDGFIVGFAPLRYAKKYTTKKSAEATIRHCGLRTCVAVKI